MMHPKERTAWIAMVALAALAVIVPRFLEPRPYWGVQAEWSVENGDALLIADFAKNAECARAPVEDGGYVVKGIGPFGVDTLRFVDLEGRDDNEDRIAGVTTLRHRFIGGARYDRIEVWTRHYCYGEKIDRMFAAHEVAR